MELSYSFEDINKVARTILDNGIKNIVLFHAGMGVGKTTLIKAIVKQLGVTDATSSPTFSLVNEYLSENGSPIYHFDLYRLKTEEEAYDMGIDEYFYSGNLCLIEWPEKTPNLIPLDHTTITITQLADGKRHIQVK